MRSRCAAFFVMAIVLCAAAPAQEMYTISSRFYSISTDVDHALAKEIASHMDIVYAEYVRRFAQFGTQGRQRQPLYVFRKQSDYMAFLQRHGINATGTGGMYFRTSEGSGLATFVENQSMARMFHTLRHEGFHQFAAARIGSKLPPWANEGIAEYFGEAIVVGHRLITGKIPPTKLDVVDEHIRAGEAIPFDKLLNMSGQEWNQRVNDGKGRLQYEQAWSIVQFLVNADRRYRAAFNDYLQMVAHGTASREAFRRAFGTDDYHNFEAAWKRYMLAAKADPETTAAQRLEFIAMGLQYLQEHHRSVSTIDELRATLQRIDFRVTQPIGHGMTLTLSSHDEDMFNAPQPVHLRGKPATLELTDPASSDVPPGAIVKGLDLTIKLVWQRDDAGRLVSRIIYE